MGLPIPTREMPEWIVDGMAILEEKAAFLNMACLAMSLLGMDRVKEISTPNGWKGFSWYTMDIVDELHRMKNAANGNDPDD